MGKIKSLFLDIGGVLMTNGWDHRSRKAAVEKFGLDFDEFEVKHRQFNPLLEKDEISLEEYIKCVVFWKERSFTPEQFRDFMFEQSKPHPEVINYFKELKKTYSLRVTIISNESRALTLYRLKLADLTSLADDFFVSCFVHLQKPDPRIFKQASEVTQTPFDRVFYIDDRVEFIEKAAAIGISGLAHVTLDQTKQQLNALLEKR